MSVRGDTTIADILQEWYDAKREIYRLEKKCAKYKTMMGKVMDEKDKNVIQRSGIVLTRRHDSRRVLLKSNVPKDMWDRYSTVTYFDTYSIRKAPKKKKSI